MSTERVTGIESTGPTDEESSDQLTQLQHRLDTLEDEKERVENELRAVFEEAQSEIQHLQSELEDTHEQHREDRHALARENHELRSSQEQLEDRIEKAEEKDSFLLDDIVDLEEQIADVEAGSSGSKGGGDAAETTMQRPDMTPIERVSKMDTEDTGIDMTASIERAVTIFDALLNARQRRGRVSNSLLNSLRRTIPRSEDAVTVADDVQQTIRKISSSNSSL